MIVFGELESTTALLLLMTLDQEQYQECKYGNTSQAADNCSDNLGCLQGTA